MNAKDVLFLSVAGVALLSLYMFNKSRKEGKSSSSTSNASGPVTALAAATRPNNGWGSTDLQSGVENCYTKSPNGGYSHWHNGPCTKGEAQSGAKTVIN